MKKLKKNSLIGIWGFGVVGKSVAEYLCTNGYKNICIMNKEIPTIQDLNYINKNNIMWYQENEKEIFFNVCEIIIPSPGININAMCYATHKAKWVHELDLFYNNFKKPIIGVTGSIGKTSTVHILGQLLKSEAIRTAIGGNIGIPMLTLLPTQSSIDYALLEISSFQLLHCQYFAPHLAIITNIHPNHLDYHATLEEYIAAKLNIIAWQKSNTISLVPFTLRKKYNISAKKHLHAYFSAIKPNDSELKQLKINERVYYLQNNAIICYTKTSQKTILLLSPELLNISFIDNIILLASVCDLLSIDTQALQRIAGTITLPEHRIEKINTFNNIEFYNDSKATTTASTLAAVEKLKDRPLHLFIGGLSKGVNRGSFIAQLKNKIKHIYCFGQEAAILHEICKTNGIPTSCYATLDDAVIQCFSAINPGDRVVLSPAGSSYDLYKNYEERGTHFKQLIAQSIQKFMIQ